MILGPLFGFEGAHDVGHSLRRDASSEGQHGRRSQAMKKVIFMDYSQVDEAHVWVRYRLSFQHE